MTAGDFVDRIRRLARQRGVPCRFDARFGKGSHGRLYYADRFTTVKDRRKRDRDGPDAENADRPWFV